MVLMMVGQFRNPWEITTRGKFRFRNGSASAKARPWTITVVGRLAGSTPSVGGVATG